MLTKEELLAVEGGAITASLINAVARIGGIILEFGRTVGTTIVRLKTGKICKL